MADCTMVSTRLAAMVTGVALCLLLLASPAAAQQSEIGFSDADARVVGGHADYLEMSPARFVQDSVAVHHFLLGIGGKFETPGGGCPLGLSTQIPGNPVGAATIVVVPPAESVEAVANYYCISDEQAVRASVTLLVFLAGVDASNRGVDVGAKDVRTATTLDFDSIAMSGPVHAVVGQDAGGGLNPATHVWVTHGGRDGTLSRVDIETYDVVESISVASHPGEPVEVSGSLWIPHTQSDVMTVVDVETMTVVDTVTVGSGPQRPGTIGWADDAGETGVYLLISNRDSGTVSVVDAGSRVVVETVDVGPEPTPVVWIELSRFLRGNVVASRGGSKITLFRGGEDGVLDRSTLDLGNGPGLPIRSDNHDQHDLWPMRADRKVVAVHSFTNESRDIVLQGEAEWVIGAGEVRMAGQRDPNVVTFWRWAARSRSQFVAVDDVLLEAANVGYEFRGVPWLALPDADKVLFVDVDIDVDPATLDVLAAAVEFVEWSISISGVPAIPQTLLGFGIPNQIWVPTDHGVLVVDPESVDALLAAND